ncbi:hypothetical protein [Pseudalkalibacillus decolorationis]|uniref:hypothetical protein n=1 Tax=Pseudalkalibacillus decolorationis TaxID=163879 RepID=UPI0021495623|nr:hypothetical protein [Pseudalkalibacillus decolorationis]
MRGKKGLKVFLVITMIAVFFLISEWFKHNEETSFAVDTDAFNVVESKEALEKKLIAGMKFYDSETLKKVYEHDFATDLDHVEVSILESNRKLRIEKVWEDNLGFLVTYSLNLLPDDKKPGSVPYLSMNRISLQAKGKDPLELGIDVSISNSPYRWVSEGIVYENRLYRMIWIDTKKTEQTNQTLTNWVKDEDQLKSTEDAIRLIEDVSFEEIELVHITKEKSATKVDDITFHMDLGKRNKVLKSIKLNKKVDIGSGNHVLFKRLDVYLKNSRLYLEFPNQSETFQKITFKINDYVHTSGLLQNGNGEFYLIVPNMEPIAGDNKLNIQLINGINPSEKEIKFTITAKELHSFKKVVKDKAANPIANTTQLLIDHKVGNYGENEFVLKKLVKKGRTVGYELYVNNKNKRYVDIWFMTKEQKEKIPKKYRAGNQPMLEVTDRNGTPLKIEKNYGLSTKRGKSLYYGFKAKQFKQTDEIHVKLLNIPEIQTFSKNQITFERPTID